VYPRYKAIKPYTRDERKVEDSMEAACSIYTIYTSLKSFAKRTPSQFMNELSNPNKDSCDMLT
jgi:hypothetical protein